MKRIFLTLAGCVAMFAAPCAVVDAATVFNTTGNTFVDATGTGVVLVPDISSTDLANGITPTFIFVGGNENVSNGNVGLGTDGAQGLAGTGFNGGGFNVGNGNGLALYTIDLGSPQFIDSVNVYSQSPGDAGGNRQDQTFTIFGHSAALEFDPSFNFMGDDIVFNDPSLDSFAGAEGLIATTAGLTTIGSVNEVNPGSTLYGASTVDAGNQSFQFITVLADAQGNAGGGGESTVFTEIDVIQGTAVPEPSSLAMLGLLFGAAAVRRRK